MKKTLFSAVLAATFGLVAFSNAAAASDGQITFTGEIIDGTCVVTGGTGTDGAAKNITVKLDKIQASALATAEQTAGDHPFSLVVSGGASGTCADGSKVSLHFDGTAATTLGASLVNSTTGRLKNLSGTGQATNVEVGVLDSAGAKVNMWTNAGSPIATVASGSATLNYVAQYVATGGAATPGLVNTAVMYSVQYN
ncbi:fimbrial protein [Dyella kyungheensis]|jgi:major type 1 subunit fimbrin (pilin)|uniref:Type 1 fimbrial protein n=1 Tax=Dyella kyungheensis TaxID=1242174 RepID=A0ABS2JSH3_9GAMM|nr:fimbrial protein [Dyella kyungheensis]MBM7121408.1 type 1 fimbrial protein [Dyella kyungheensis]